MFGSSNGLLSRTPSTYIKLPVPGGGGATLRVLGCQPPPPPKGPGVVKNWCVLQCSKETTLNYVVMTMRL